MRVRAGASAPAGARAGLIEIVAFIERRVRHVYRRRRPATGPNTVAECFARLIDVCRGTAEIQPRGCNR